MHKRQPVEKGQMFGFSSVGHLAKPRKKKGKDGVYGEKEDLTFMKSLGLGKRLQNCRF